MSRPLRVVHWYWQSNPGGIHRVVCDLVRAQEEAGMEPLRVVGRRGPGDGTALDLRMRHGFDVLRLPRAKRTLQAADLVHMHSYNPVVARALRSAGTPCVYTDHGSDRYPSLRNRVVLFGLQRRFVRSRPRIVTVNSEYRRGTQAAFYGLEPDRVRVVWNGLDFDALRPRRAPADVRAEFGIPADRPHVGTVAVFQRCKRTHLVLEALARARLDAALLVVGDGPPRHALERRARALGIADRTVFTGMRADAGDLMAALDAFVLPTEGEGFGLAALEALAVGTPAVVWRDGGGLLEIVRHGTSGFVVADVDEAAARIRQLCTAPELRRRMGDAGAADVRERFSVARMARGIRACYEECLGTGKSPALRAP